jgi:hypothetical protein
MHIVHRCILHTNTCGSYELHLIVEGTYRWSVALFTPLHHKPAVLYMVSVILINVVVYLLSIEKNYFSKENNNHLDYLKN